ncbi:hypothetical protein CUMW_195290, partial [Citrus unshiu]
MYLNKKIERIATAIEPPNNQANSANMMDDESEFMPFSEQQILANSRSCRASNRPPAASSSEMGIHTEICIKEEDIK